MIDVLIVEDTDETARTIARFLAGYGFSVVVCGSIREALNTDRPRLAIVDNELPDGTGADVIAALDGVPCIPITGSGEWIGPLPPAVPLLKKPFAMSELVALVAARLAEGG